MEEDMLKVDGAVEDDDRGKDAESKPEARPR